MACCMTLWKCYDHFNRINCKVDPFYSINKQITCLVILEYGILYGGPMFALNQQSVEKIQRRATS